MAGSVYSGKARYQTRGSGYSARDILAKYGFELDRANNCWYLLDKGKETTELIFKLRKELKNNEIEDIKLTEITFVAEAGFVPPSIY